MELFGNKQLKADVADLKLLLAEERDETRKLKDEQAKLQEELKAKAEGMEKLQAEYQNKVKILKSLQDIVKEREREIQSLYQELDNPTPNPKISDRIKELERTIDVQTKFINQMKIDNYMDMDMLCDKIAKSDFSNLTYAGFLKDLLCKEAWVVYLKEELTKEEKQQYKKDMDFIRKNPVLPVKDGIDPNDNLKCKKFIYVKNTLADKWDFRRTMKRYYEAKLLVQNLGTKYNLKRYLLADNKEQGRQNLQDFALMYAVLYGIGAQVDCVKYYNHQLALTEEEYSAGYVRAMLTGCTDFKDDLGYALLNAPVYTTKDDKIMIVESRHKRIQPASRKSQVVKKAPIPIVEPLHILEPLLALLLHKGYDLDAVTEWAGTLLRSNPEIMHEYDNIQNTYRISLKHI